MRLQMRYCEKTPTEALATALQLERSLAVACVRCTLTYLQASTTFCSLKRQGSGANLVAMTGCVPVSFMKSCRNSSESPNPYTYTGQYVVIVAVTVYLGLVLPRRPENGTS